jgi:hypothetical protein
MDGCYKIIKNYAVVVRGVLTEKSGTIIRKCTGSTGPRL